MPSWLRTWMLCWTLTLAALVASPAQAQEDAPPASASTSGSEEAPDFPTTPWLTPEGHRALLVSIPRWRTVRTLVGTTLPETQRALEVCNEQWKAEAKRAALLEAEKPPRPWLWALLGGATGATLVGVFVGVLR